MLVPRMNGQETKMRRRGGFWATAWLVALAVVAGLSFPWDQRTFLAKRFANYQAVQRLGLAGYGVFDVVDLVSGAKRRWELARLDITPYRRYLRQLAENRTPRRETPGQARKHVVFIQLESLDGLVLNARKDGAPLMPFLESVAHDGVYFANALDNTAAGRTTDGEFMVLTSQVPLVRSPVYVSESLDRIPSLPRALGAAGYRSVSLHGYHGMFWRRAKAHEDLGFDEAWFRGDLPLDERIGWGWSDRQVLQEAARRVIESDEPLFLHVITLTNHHPYGHVGRAQGLPPVSIEEEYRRSIRYVDDCLAAFFTELEKAGKSDECLVAIFGDHDSGITSKLITHLDEFDEPMIRDTVPLVLTGFERESRRVDDLAGLQDLPVMVLEELGLDGPVTFTGNGWEQWGTTVGASRGPLRSRNGAVESMTLSVDHEVLTKLALVRTDELLMP